MSTSTLIQDKIEKMPQNLQEQVLEYIEFLIQKYEVETPLSEQETKELRNRYAAYKENPDSAISL